MLNEFHVFFHVYTGFEDFTLGFAVTCRAAASLLPFQHPPNFTFYKYQLSGKSHHLTRRPGLTTCIFCIDRNKAPSRCSAVSFNSIDSGSHGSTHAGKIKALHPTTATSRVLPENNRRQCRPGLLVNLLRLDRGDHSKSTNRWEKGGRGSEG